MAMSTPSGIEGPLLELCRWCDAANDGATATLVEALLAGVNKETARTVAELAMDWYWEVMASRGWVHRSFEESFAAWEDELAAGRLGPEDVSRIPNQCQRLEEPGP